MKTRILQIASMILGLAGLISASLFSASTPSPGGKHTADPDFGTTQVGALTINQVKVNNVVLTAGVDYDVVGQGSSQAHVELLVAPPAGTPVEVSGTTANNGGPFTGTLNWSA